MQSARSQRDKNYQPDNFSLKAQKELCTLLYTASTYMPFIFLDADKVIGFVGPVSSISNTQSNL